jgi:hypothetical protein
MRDTAYDQLRKKKWETEAKERGAIYVIDGDVFTFPSTFIACDGCNRLLYTGDMIPGVLAWDHTKGEVVIAPGQTMLPDGRGQWQGAPTCTDCTLMTRVAFQYTNGARCFACDAKWEENHWCDRMDDTSDSSRETYFWNLRTRLITEKRIALQWNYDMPNEHRKLQL